MKQSEPNKRAWVKPQVLTLSIKKDTFSGSSTPGSEVGGEKEIVLKQW